MSSKDQKIENQFQIFREDQKSRWFEVEPSIWAPDDDGPGDDVALSIIRTLWDQPRRIEPRFLYDERGSRLFEKISTLPEYYLTRTEETILSEEAKQIMALASVECLVELGAGFSKKTVHLLEEQVGQRRGGVFVPIDVSVAALVGSRDSVQEQFPEIEFHGLRAPYEKGISSIEKSLPTLFVFLGSSVGNFDRSEFAQFFQLLEGCMGSNDFFLLGVDWDKEKEIIENAYNDSQGITAEFILNAFSSVNRILGSNFDLERVRYHCLYNSQWRQVEMYGISTCKQVIDLPSVQSQFVWEEGERILVEISRKFDSQQLQRQLQFFGFQSIAHFTDP
ncbi:L-histidine N(alpha)-methyltransferase, partial [Acidobacteria bacterium AH-259-D05]|nr:L-histidine N(alpha)-methyltransferase [Acidobacteria bacterium AH-259-D05]